MLEEIGLLALGYLGIIIIIPKILRSDNGSKQSHKIAKICFVGSALLIFSGIFNKDLPSGYPLKYGILGFGLQLGSLCLSNIKFK